MKILWVIPCLALCACMANNRDDSAYQASYQGGAYPANAAVATTPAYEVAPAAPQVVKVANPYAMEPPAYEQSQNLVLNQKEQELFQKEKNLLDSQQELYEREKKLADREAAFINRSKALDYKEKNIMEGRSYAPTSVPATEYVVPAGQNRVFYGQPQPAPMPAPAPVAPVPPPAPVMHPVVQSVAPQPVPAYEVPVAPAPQPMPEAEFALTEEVIDFNASSEPAPYEPTQAGFIIMQHPIQRDLVRCPVTDDVCLQSYERLGYVRSANLSRFTAQDELNTAGTYPTNASGQWRENNSIPRW